MEHYSGINEYDSVNQLQESSAVARKPRDAAAFWFEVRRQQTLQVQE